ncbi:hypothetical protein [Pseudolactococcus yaeyamensis]
MNSACITSDVFGFQKCDCKWQLEKAILESFKIKKVIFLGNNLKKNDFIESCGVEVVDILNLAYDEMLVTIYLTSVRSQSI